jgi:hypothetical protein
VVVRSLLKHCALGKCWLRVFRHVKSSLLQQATSIDAVCMLTLLTGHIYHLRDGIVGSEVKNGIVLWRWLSVEYPSEAELMISV